QIQERQTTSLIFLRDTYDQTQVGLDQPLLGQLIAFTDAPRKFALFCGAQQLNTADGAQIKLDGILSAQFLAQDDLGISVIAESRIVIAGVSLLVCRKSARED